jgi:hypothetical protein
LSRSCLKYALRLLPMHATADSFLLRREAMADL